MKQILSGVLLLLACSSAHAVTIDFEDVALASPGFSDILTQPFASGGFEFSYGPENFMRLARDQQEAFNGTTYLVASGGCCGPNTQTMSQTGGASFNLMSLEIAEFNDNWSIGVKVTGHKSGGGTVTQIINMDGVYDGAGSTNDFESILFDASWTNLTQVDFQRDPFVDANLWALDNIAVSTVPVPPAVWLFGSALGVMGWMRRKATS